MSNLNRIKETEKMLKTLGTVDDGTELLSENYRNKILRVYDLYENKYNAISDDTLCVYVYSNGTYVVTNEDLPYTVYTIEERDLLQKLFAKTSFEIKVAENKSLVRKYLAYIDVSASANDLSKVKELIIKYRDCNDIFLSDKVESIIGDDGKIYLDRSN